MSAEKATPYRYTESGLETVFIHGIKLTIDEDGDEVVTIPNVNGLHKAIALAIIGRPGLMTGKELRFLRTEMGMTQAELATCIHKEPQSVGRWERGEVGGIDPNAETLIRLLAREKLGLELHASVAQLTGYSVATAKLPPIEIDGSNPDDYRPMAA
ncbi:MAG: helix-turn-helix domain-containing protein [Alphaproteobacteria bacterium]|nr:helix-turn-helix domain-containing protein [Alphaproteobacteria bacterium]